MNRVVVIAACVCWAFIIRKDVQEDVPTSSDGAVGSNDARPLKLHQWKDAIFLLILALGILERLSRLANLVSIERDWVPTMVTIRATDKQQPPYDLSRLNAIMSRIDLVCKLGAPIAVSAFMSATNSPRLGAVLLIGLNFLTWPVEYWTASTVWNGNEQLREAKVVDGSEVKELAASESKNGASFSLADLLNAPKATLNWIYEYGRSLQQYFSTDVWMPSLAMSTLHSSVLTFSSTLIVFLVNSGFSMTLITWAEVLSAAFELSSTFVFPPAIRLLGNERKSTYSPLADDEETTSTPTTPLRSTFEVTNNTKADHKTYLEQRQITGVSKLGLLAITLTLLSLIPSVPAVWHISTSWPTPTTIPNNNNTQPSAWHTHTTITLLIILFISFSRLGRFTSSLCAQQLAQSCVLPAKRSVFAGTEASIASAFGLAHYAATAVWSAHEDFRWIALASVVVVAGGVALYAFWLVNNANGERRLRRF